MRRSNAVSSSDISPLLHVFSAVDQFTLEATEKESRQKMIRLYILIALWKGLNYPLQPVETYFGFSLFILIEVCIWSIFTVWAFKNNYHLNMRLHVNTATDIQPPKYAWFCLSGSMNNFQAIKEVSTMKVKK